MHCEILGNINKTTIDYLIDKHSYFLASALVSALIAISAQAWEPMLSSGEDSLSSDGLSFHYTANEKQIHGIPTRFTICVGRQLKKMELKHLITPEETAIDDARQRMMQYSTLHILEWV
jgi:hypothetical protein